ncbi:hypothetical protein EAF00_012035 [Botryotinia globosa]|nr:hypothetical protein EAF00_012035 [Botryotinia globosa]
MSECLSSNAIHSLTISPEEFIKQQIKSKLNSAAVARTLSIAWEKQKARPRRPDSEFNQKK